MSTKTYHNETIRFRLIACPACNHQMCWVNPRLPSYCPECAQHIYALLVTSPDRHIHVDTRDATLRYSNG